MVDDPLVLRFGGSLVEQLGAQLYPSATATVAELISNAWDADAKNVWVTIPFGEDWKPESEITVVDDGHGMTREDAQRTYLIVGRKRRVEEKTDESVGGRKVHGRKGIGKLAAFGTAGILECCTKKAGELTSFRLDYDKIRKLKPDEDYEVEDAEEGSGAPTDPDDKELESGTRVRLTRLLVKRKINEQRFVRSMSRRFSLSQTEMNVFINGSQLSRFDVPTQFRFPSDGVPDGREVKVEDGWAVEELGNEEEIRWWIGFTEKPIEEDYLKGVSVLARGKLGQRPFTFERSQGTTGQLGQEYLVGEVQADWLDRGKDIEDDLIQSNRDQLRLEDERTDPLIDWGRKTVEWALRKRNELRQGKAMDDFEASDELKELLKDFTKAEQDRYMRVARTVSKFPEMTGDGILDIVRGVVNGSDQVQVRQMMEQIESEDPAVQERFWALVHQFGLIDARKNLSIIEGRLAAIGRLKDQVSAGAPEVPDLHKVVRDDPWLLDPRWSLLGDEIPLSDLDLDFKPESDEESGKRLDYLFVLRPKEPAPVDEVVVVEIKRGYDSSGKERRADVGEVNAFHQYVAAVEKRFEKSSDRPRVRGLMIAQGYTGQANDVRKNLEKIGDPKLEFKTWDRVIDETERLHTGWLAVSKERADAGEQDATGGDAPSEVEESAATVAEAG
jgi:hypothetical protein